MIMSNHRHRRDTPRQPADIDPDSLHGRIRAAPALSRRLPTVAELAWLSELGYDVVTGPSLIHAVETAEGTRYEDLHKIGWPQACGCNVPACTGEVNR
jgi:hypothetical protein